tara:strand:- start:106 stop:483 length:378 start_codon:yes stop_codon:yes gene_type:complete
MGDCILFADLASKYIKIHKNDYDLKYISIYCDDWGGEEQEFHYYLRFKFNNKWYFMDRCECVLGRNGYKGKKVRKQITYEKVSMGLYLSRCGFKNQLDAQEDIFKVVDKHLRFVLISSGIYSSSV